VKDLPNQFATSYSWSYLPLLFFGNHILDELLKLAESLRGSDQRKSRGIDLVTSRYEMKVLGGNSKIITRAHSFLRTVEFRAQLWNLGFYSGIEPRNFAAEFVFFRGIARNLTLFIRTTFFTENYLKVALLQVCVRW